MQMFKAEWESGRQVSWRSLSWKEYKRFEAQLRYESAAKVYLDVYATALVEGPPAYEANAVYAAPAGLVEWVGKFLLENDPFGGQYQSVRYALDLKRRELQSNYLATARAIVAAIFHYSFEEIDTWDSETFFERVAAAEAVSGHKIEPGDPAAQKKKPARKPPTSDIQAPTQRFIDPRMPAPSEETVIGPETTGSSRRTRQLTPAQEMLFERRQKG